MSEPLAAVQALLGRLSALDIRLRVDGERLSINAPKGALTASLRADLLQLKGELIAHLCAVNASATPVERPALPALVPVPREARMPLAHMQQRLWFLRQMDPTSSTYNVGCNFHMRGPLDVRALERTLADLIQRHESLRMRFGAFEGTPWCEVMAEMPLPLQHVDLADLPEAEREVAGLQALLEHFQQPFDLAHGPLVRLKLIRLTPEWHLFGFAADHIVCDGISVGIFFHELQQLYRRYVGLDAETLPMLPVQYLDYVQWQRQVLAAGALDEHLTYWKEQLRALPPVLNLPADRPRPRVLSSRGTRRLEVWPVSLASELKALARREGVTLYMLLLAAYQVLLWRYSGEVDFAVGTAVGAREQPGVERVVGFFANNVVQRADVSGNPTVRELLHRVREVALKAYAHQDMPFDVLVDALAPRRDLGHSPLFQVLLVFHSFMVDGADLGSVTCTSVDLPHRTSRFDLSVDIFDRPEGLRTYFEYSTDLFDEASIARMMSHYRHILNGMLADAGQRVGDLPLLSATELRQLRAWNEATTAQVPMDMVYPQLFEAQADAHPDRIAVSFEGRALTYRELNARANQLAWHLRSLGVGAGVLVGVCLHRGLDLPVALLGIQKAGGAYVPLDPGFPGDRLAFMLEDSNAAVLVSGGLAAASIDLPSTLEVVNVDHESAVLAALSTANPGAFAVPRDTAYLMYTSGSTGQPKGVAVSHGSLVNFLASMRQKPGLNERDVLASVTTISFDIAGLELYLPWMVGARVELVSGETAADGAALASLLEASRANVLQATPTTWRLLVEAGWRPGPGFRALCGGEALPRDLADAVLERTDELWNLYGPTETTIWSTVESVQRGTETIMIGRPIANTQIYVVDEKGKQLPVGVPGEIWIGGDGVALGYHRRPELTAERFVVDRFGGGAGARLYRTGDFGRYHDDGRIEHLGRIDHQVKLRGFRIELGEIEAVLAAHGSVRQALAMIREDRSGRPSLTAYVVCATGQEDLATELRDFLRTKLPGYMVPQHIMSIDSFPLTPNGKIDRKQLPAPWRDAPADHKGFVSPRNETERTLGRIFSEVLELPEVGIHDNFFDLGGHSLLAVKLRSSIAGAFGVNLPLQVLFDAPTVVGLGIKLADATRAAPAATGDAAPVNAATDSTPADEGEPATATQRHLLTIWERLFPGQKVGIGDSFVDLQGSRDLLDTMLADVRRDFRVFAEGLPVVTFLQDPTIASLARIIDAAARPGTSILVCMQPEGFKPPLFLIHAGGGYVFFYRALVSRLGKDRPVYAVRAETAEDGLGQPFDQSESIEQLAARYIAEIKAVRPLGPYCLGGSCIGGVVAFEMARQLRARGEEVADPVLAFDSFVLNNPRARAYEQKIRKSQRSPSLRARLSGLWDQVSELRVDRKITLIAENTLRVLCRPLIKIGARAIGSTKQLARKIGTSFGDSVPVVDEQLQFSDSFLRTSMRLLLEYKPEAYQGRIVLMKATEGIDPAPLWAGLAAQGMVVHRMPGVHLDMMDEPIVARTAALAVNYLDNPASRSEISIKPSFERALHGLSLASMPTNDKFMQ